MTEICANCGHEEEIHGGATHICYETFCKCEKFKPQNHSLQENKEKLDLGVGINESCELSNTLEKQISTPEDTEPEEKCHDLVKSPPSGSDKEFTFEGKRYKVKNHKAILQDGKCQLCGGEGCEACDARKLKNESLSDKIVFIGDPWGYAISPSNVKESVQKLRALFLETGNTTIYSTVRKWYKTKMIQEIDKIFGKELI